MIHFAVYTLLVYLFKPFMRSYVNTPRLIASLIIVILDLVIFFKSTSQAVQIICCLFACLFFCNFIRRIYYLIMQNGWLKCNNDMSNAKPITNVQNFCKSVIRLCQTLPEGDSLYESLFDLYKERSNNMNSFIGDAIFNAISKFKIGEIVKTDLKNICEKTNKKINNAIFFGKCHPNFFDEVLPQEIEGFISKKTKGKF